MQNNLIFILKQRQTTNIFEIHRAKEHIKLPYRQNEGYVKQNDPVSLTNKLQRTKCWKRNLHIK